MKKITSLILAAATTVTFALNAFAAPTVPGAVYSDQQAAGANKPVTQIQEELSKAGITDIQPTDWYAGSVTVLVQAGLITPTQDGSFQPEATLTSSEGISVFAKVLGLAAKNDTPEQALTKAKEAGLVPQGVSAEENLSRIDVAMLISKALGVEPKAITSEADYPFADFEGLTAEERGIMKALYDLGIFRGYPQEGGKPTFNPGNILTKAEISLLVDRILGGR